ncbi:Calcium-dependent protein kinase 2 [Babesia sp. Xinjiang]|uniref:Calcium-dependent protein kinase 2 n=1 Tax=Babesia sp. Xinjiang TaxID=462227 RepID=UPI000A23191C|nr:Calcium-dependent protein kinase 2 [Babesia sp. Xinjiang]XP_028871434.1 Calcium-dependent protein kinase 2 [Babesia sp. Xinjiang]ORM40856.1 Calcium-dependent protein kinase 2 [Babesia sp. Xinjiang]ORM40978.1 Calcium-dependent protein kinase 2 [Babesia sp. Xinjiang]
MGNCCTTGGKLTGGFGQGTENSGRINLKDRNRTSFYDRMLNCEYIRPKICDVFNERLGQPVWVHNGNASIALEDQSSSPDNDSGYSSDWENDTRSFVVHCRSARSSDPSDSSTPTRLSFHPKMFDLMLSKDIWLSRVITEYKMNTRYNIIADAIGFGVGGSVRQAVDKKSHRTFALKSLKTDCTTRKRVMSSFNEVIIYTQLDHPNIAFLHEVYEEPGFCHILMEYCTGGELYDRLDRYKRFAEGYAKRVTVQMLLAINYLHSNGICHRDLKLENWVFSTPDMGATLKMIDFGFSRLYEDGVPMAGTHGTVYYVDPEVIDGCYSEKCDIWSTGVIVYMLLSGSPPFNGEEDKEILWKIKKGILKFEGVRWSKISQDAKDFITLLLNRDSNHRASAIEALNHPWLDDELQNFDSSSLTPEVLRHIVEFSKRPPMYRALMALCVLEADRHIHQDVYRLFFAINTSLSGTITLKEFSDVLAEYLKLDESEAAAVFDAIAFRGTATMHYTEFVTAVYGYHAELDMNLLCQVYCKLEALGNGRLDEKTLVAYIGERFSGIPVSKLFRHLDVDNKGFIELSELRDCLVGVH